MWDRRENLRWEIRINDLWVYWVLRKDFIELAALIDRICSIDAKYFFIYRSVGEEEGVAEQISSLRAGDDTFKSRTHVSILFNPTLIWMLFQMIQMFRRNCVRSRGRVAGNFLPFHYRVSIISPAGLCFTRWRRKDTRTETTRRAGTSVSSITSVVFSDYPRATRHFRRWR